MKIDIMGAGSLGLLLAGMLMDSGCEVRIWCRTPDQAASLSEYGLTVSSVNGEVRTHLEGGAISAAPAANFAAEWLKLPGDWLLLAVKQTALHRELPELLIPLRDTRMNILCLQNGWGHLEMLQSLLPAASLYAGVTTEGAKRESGVRVTHAGKGHTYIGRWGEGAGESSGLESLLTARLEAAGFSASVSNQVETMIFRKLMINAVINPLTAIWRIPNGELLASAARIDLMRALYEEATAVCDAAGISREDSLWDDILNVCRATSGNRSSMLADVLASRETEIKWINGALAELARQTGVDVPLHRGIIRMIEGMIV
ncbi:2-dehydropantoate 2-reductase [Paenibacillus sp. HN-1]|uniref:ketopantoate reductase family protein n=1 Tax=Paenibacillus TaxID=44249 RepID=UPI001CA976F6|nr:MULTISPECIES: 2-dehydropantoate 2-reductase [Paenibacillus]MBY9076948.1 2-dehydropantoate 2-reductase [Paenibacillus sp. CGMCC 1.18879]MBY9086213.1 2-dehydropantoate 2-reductase [Paenibacillus sinensis]